MGGFRKSSHYSTHMEPECIELSSWGFGFTANLGRSYQLICWLLPAFLCLALCRWSCSTTPGTGDLELKPRPLDFSREFCTEAVPLALMIKRSMVKLYA